jgi:molecular chaperone GrpE
MKSRKQTRKNVGEVRDDAEQSKKEAEGLRRELAGEREKAEGFREELDEANRKVMEYTNLLQRLQADFENHVKRSEVERGEIVKTACKGLIVRMLDVVDTMDSALKVKPRDEGEGRLLDGFRKVDGQLKSILAAEGLEEVRTDGSFNHELHETVGTVEDSSRPNGAIVDVIQRGYRLNGRVIRTSKVIVVKNRGEAYG